MPAEQLLLAALLLGLTLYAVLGGADFGAGIWQALLPRRSAARERAALRDAIGPVWEANHVWLIFVLVLLQSAFPAAAAGVARALWMPMLLALAGIVARGAGLALRAHRPEDDPSSRLLDAVFVAASFAAPFFLGASLGAIADGRLGVRGDGSFDGSVFDWVRPFSLYAGLWAVALCAYLAAVFLARERVLAEENAPRVSATGAERTRVWRKRAVLCALVVGVASLAGLPVAATSPGLWEGLTTRGLPFLLASGLGGVGSAVATVLRRPTLAAAGAGVAVGSVLAGWFAARHPQMIGPAITVETARAPDSVLEATLLSLALGAAILAPSLFLLLRVFKSAHAARRLGREAAAPARPGGRER